MGRTYPVHVNNLNNFMKSLPLLLFAFLLGGCANANRTHLDPGESHYEFTIHHQMGQRPAFLKIERFFAETDFGPTSFSQPETGYMLIRSTVPYQIIGSPQDARYMLRIQINDSTILLTFDLTPPPAPPKNEMPKIQAELAVIASNISDAVNGSVDPVVSSKSRL
jgi:hypothetical protein